MTKPLKNVWILDFGIFDWLTIRGHKTSSLLGRSIFILLSQKPWQVQKPLNVSPTLPICKVYICVLLARNLGRGHNRSISVIPLIVIYAFWYVCHSNTDISVDLRPSWNNVFLCETCQAEIAELGMRISMFWSWLPLPGYMTLASHFSSPDFQFRQQYRGVRLDEFSELFLIQLFFWFLWFPLCLCLARAPVTERGNFIN